MCGRFTQRYTWQEVHEFYRLLQPARNLQPRHNVCPTTTIDVVVPRGGARELVPMRWGLVPSWWKKTLKELPSTFRRMDGWAAYPEPTVIMIGSLLKGKVVLPVSPSEDDHQSG